MASTPISGLPAATTVNTTDLFPIVQAGVTKRATIAQIIADVPNQTNPIAYNAKDFGTKGDGTTDDTTALQNAITATANTLGTLVIPPGTYITTPLTIPAIQGLTIQGSGYGTTLRLKNNTNGYVFTLTGNDTRITIRDLTIDGNCTNQTTQSGGINAAGAVACRFDNIHFNACRDDGLLLAGMTSGAFGHNNRVIGCLFDGSMNSTGPGRGIYMYGNDENQVIGCDFEFLGGSGGTNSNQTACILDKSGLQFIVACNFVGGATNNTIGVRIQDTQATTQVTACNFDGTGGDSIFIAAERANIVGNRIVGPGQVGTAGQAAGVHLQYAAKNCLIANNTIVTAGTNGATRSLIWEESIGSSGMNRIIDNTLVTPYTTSGLIIDLSAPNTVYRDSLPNGDLGGGHGSIFPIPNVATAPSTAPSGGGGYLYSNAGALLWKGGNGTVTTVAPA